MGCTFVAAGSETAEDVLRGIATGLYVRRLEAASVDPRTGRAMFRVTDADLVRDGEITAPVRACLLSVTASRALHAFEAIADDVEFDTCVGTCFKDGQPMAVSVGAPTCRLGLVRVHA
jgi:TldD protein